MRRYNRSTVRCGERDCADTTVRPCGCGERDCADTTVRPCGCSERDCADTTVRPCGCGERAPIQLFDRADAVSEIADTTVRPCGCGERDCTDTTVPGGCGERDCADTTVRPADAVSEIAPIQPFDRADAVSEIADTTVRPVRSPAGGCTRLRQYNCSTVRMQ